MPASTLHESITISVTITGPGGDPIGDCRLVGTVDSIDSFAGVIGTELIIPVVIANDNTVKAYKVIDAIAERIDGSSVMSGFTGQGTLPAGIQDSRIDLKLTPLESVRGTKTGNYKLFVLVDEV